MGNSLSQILRLRYYPLAGLLLEIVGVTGVKCTSYNQYVGLAPVNYFLDYRAVQRPFQALRKALGVEVGIGGGDADKGNITGVDCQTTSFHFGAQTRTAGLQNFRLIINHRIGEHLNHRLPDPARTDYSDFVHSSPFV